MDASSYPESYMSFKKPGKGEHNVKIVYSCNECDVQCHGKPAFTRHLKLHITFKCPACSKVYKDKNMFRRHLSDHEKRFECTKLRQLSTGGERNPGNRKCVDNIINLFH